MTSAAQPKPAMTFNTRLQAFLLRQWQRRGWFACLAWPLGAVVAQIAHRRQRKAVDDRTGYRPRFKVIVVGSIYVGGTGKTPVVVALVQALKQAGLQVAVLGHRYNSLVHDPAPDEPAIFHNGHQRLENADALGDEAAMLAYVLDGLGVPVIAGNDRAACARLIEQDFPQAQVVVLDDGLQHYALARDVEIAVLDERGVGNGWCIPAGPLRELPQRLAQCDAVLVRDAANVFSEAPRHSQQLHVSTVLSDAVNLVTGAKVSLSQLGQQTAQGMSVLAVAGIGQPQRFFDALAQHGIACKTLALPDHADYDHNPLQHEPADAVLLTTSKDAIKLQRFADQRMYYVPLVMQLPEQLIEQIKHKLALPPELKTIKES